MKAFDELQKEAAFMTINNAIKHYGEEWNLYANKMTIHLSDIDKMFNHFAIEANKRLAKYSNKQIQTIK